MRKSLVLWAVFGIVNLNAPKNAKGGVKNRTIREGWRFTKIPANIVVNVIVMRDFSNGSSLCNSFLIVSGTLKK